MGCWGMLLKMLYSWLRYVRFSFLLFLFDLFVVVRVSCLLLQDGLERRGFKESGFLKEVTEVVRTGIDSGPFFYWSYYSFPLPLGIITLKMSKVSVNKFLIRTSFFCVFNYLLVPLCEMSGATQPSRFAYSKLPPLQLQFFFFSFSFKYFSNILKHFF